MPTLINNPELEEELIAQRRSRGIDQFDEVWDGVYVMAPIANNEHQTIQGKLVTILNMLVGFQGLGTVQGGANVTDRETDWRQNYRVPDVLVFLNKNSAEDRDTHWYGGPDFAVEILSPHDRGSEKSEFYARVGVRELLLIGRDPWQLELFRLDGGRLITAGIATEANSITIQSQIVPVTFQLTAAGKRPAIRVTALNGQAWAI